MCVRVASEALKLEVGHKRRTLRDAWRKVISGELLQAVASNPFLGFFDLVGGNARELEARSIELRLLADAAIPLRIVPRHTNRHVPKREGQIRHFAPLPVEFRMPMTRWWGCFRSRFTDPQHPGPGAQQNTGCGVPEW